MGQDIEIKRRIPTQKRAEQTISTIFEAAAQILERDEGGLTTNHIAERAGYSIGTLYGYFPDKLSLLRAMAQREMKRQEAHVFEILASAHDETAEGLVRKVVQSALRPFGKQSRVRRYMIGRFARDPEVLASVLGVQQNLLDVLLRALSTLGFGYAREHSSSARFTILAAVTGAIQSGAANNTEVFESEAFEDELVKLVLRGLTPR